MRTHVTDSMADGQIIAEASHDFLRDLDRRQLLAVVEKLSVADQQALWAVVAPRRDAQYPSCRQLCPEAPHRIRYRGQKVLARLKALLRSQDID